MSKTLSFESSKISDGNLWLYKPNNEGSNIRVGLNSSDIKAREMTNIFTRAFAFIAAMFGFGVYSRVKIGDDYKTFWCDKSISQTWAQKDTVEYKVETLFNRVIFEQLA